MIHLPILYLRRQTTHEQHVYFERNSIETQDVNILRIESANIETRQLQSSKFRKIHHTSLSYLTLSATELPNSYSIQYASWKQRHKTDWLKVGQILPCPAFSARTFPYKCQFVFFRILKVQRNKEHGDTLDSHCDQQECQVNWRTCNHERHLRVQVETADVRLTRKVWLHLKHLRASVECFHIPVCCTVGLGAPTNLDPVL